MWSNELELKFIEHLQSEPILWDQRHKYYKDKTYNYDAWQRIGEKMGMPVPEIKKKKESLYASYRKYRKLVKDSTQSGAGESDIYQPIWFAYQALDAFLGDRLTVRQTINTTTSSGQPSTSTNTNEEVENRENSETQENIETPETRTELKKTPNRSRFSQSEVRDAGKNLQKAISLFEETVKKREAPLDDSEIYAMGLAKKLRAFAEEERLEIMYEIDGMILRHRRAKHLNTFDFINNLDSPYNRPLSDLSSASNYSEPVISRNERHNNRTAFSEPPVIHIPDNTEVRNKSKVHIISDKMVYDVNVLKNNVIFDAYDKA